MSTHHSRGQASSQEAFEALYERCLSDIVQRLTQTTALTSDTMQAVARTVRDALTQRSREGQDDVQRVIDRLVTAWQQAFASRAATPPERTAAEAVQRLASHSASLIAELAGALKTVAEEVENRLQHELTYHTGTVVETGNFFCLQCDKEIRKVKIGPLPPCSRCHGTVFRRHRRP